jgi:hypothetical protein
MLLKIFLEKDVINYLKLALERDKELSEEDRSLVPGICKDVSDRLKILLN